MALLGFRSAFLVTLCWMTLGPVAAMAAEFRPGIEYANIDFVKGLRDYWLKPALLSHNFGSLSGTKQMA